MGLKCRLLGHEYGDPELERERQENGDEVVVTIRELQVCERCGTEHLVSENKEVTSIRSPSEVGLGEGGATRGPARGAAPTSDSASAPGATPGGPEPDTADPASHISEAEPNASHANASPGDGSAGEADADADAGTGFADDDDDFEPPTDPEEDDAVILDDDGERDPTQWPEETEADPAAAAEESAAAEDLPEDLPRDGDGEPVTDDAELIDAGPETDSRSDSGSDADDATAARGHGEWPAREELPEDEGGSNAPWPEHTGEDEGFDAEPSDGTPAEVAFGGGLTPETNGHAEAHGETDGAVGGDDGFARAENELDLEADVPDERVEFYCPNCDHARTAGASSMRAGDICPECKRGYIAERHL
ncbi:DUF7093 family protein [Halopelagius fulvigenes]|uniref:Oxidoreductase n=1 Tax=Halopelagius fulvigenes TaxID=1198324 RepID=A0ABD5U1J4_9EURY